MKTILLHYPDLDNNRIFQPNYFGFNDPLIYLKERLYSLGYDIKTSDNNSLIDCEWVIFFNNSPSTLINLKEIKYWKKNIRSWFLFHKKENEIRDLYKECIENNFKNIAIILWDNDVVCPGNFSKTLHEKFPVIFTWNDDYIDNKKFFKIYHPISQKIPKIQENFTFKDKKLLVNISRNKYASNSKDLYSERRKAISYFEKNFPDDFDLFGMGWNKPTVRWQKIFPYLTPKFSSYRGKIETKSILSHYKFSLCYENLKEEKGYISEKIFDCMRLGTVPIYWGASNVTDYIPKDSFIDRREFKSNNELGRFIKNIDEKKHNKYLKAIDDFLKSDKFKLFLPENFANTIIKTLNLKNI